MPKVTIEKLIFGGQGLGRVDNKVAFVWGALPGEEVEFAVTRKKKNFMEGIVTKVITPSPSRIEPRDDHYLSCSPWQTMSFEQEQKWKKDIALETYKKIGDIEIEDIEKVSDGREYGYRNKMEFNFVEKDGRPSFAFHTRGTHRLVPVGDCALASPAIITASHKLLAWLAEERVPAGILKSVIFRSNSAGQVAIALFIKSKDLTPTLSFPSTTLRAGVRRGKSEHSLILPEGGPTGLQIYYSYFRSPASVPTELLYSSGQSYLEEEVAGAKLRYGLLSFFQVNVPMFEMALADVTQFVSGGAVVDYYSGVGAIGLPLAGKCNSLQLVEENREAVEYARQNIALNSATNAEAVAARSEAALEHITPEVTVILDPPRTGLHADVVKRLAAVRPERVIYLSCGLDTHARDVSLLLPEYRPIFWKLYNFFPRTPHIEGLCVLERQ